MATGRPEPLDRCLSVAGAERRRADHTFWVERTLAMLDGYSIAVVTGAPVGREQVLSVLCAHATSWGAADSG